jgi:hypothetical protein
MMTLLMVLLGWVLFRASDLTQAAAYFRTMFGLNHVPLTDGTLTFYFKDYLSVLMAGLLCSTPLFARLKDRLAGKNEKGACAAGTEAAVWVIQLALFLISVGALLMGAHNPFIYFNF